MNLPVLSILLFGVFEFFVFCVITFEPIMIQTCSAPQSDRLIFSFVKDIEVVVEQMTRNHRKMIGKTADFFILSFSQHSVFASSIPSSMAAASSSFLQQTPSSRFQSTSLMVQTCLCFLWGQQNGYCNDHKNCIEIKIWTLSATEDRLGKNWSCVQLSKCCQKMQNSDLRAEIYIENLVGVA